MGRTTQTYDLLTRLAVGNGALVYRALDKITHRQVALKLLVQDGDLDHRFDVRALLEDSQRLRQITGAHVCQLLDAFRDDDGPVLVYEFANGVSGTELPAQRKLDAAQALDVAAQMISALRSGERQKCPHGDVKPSNIVFMALADKRPFTLVLDWGLTAYRTVTADDSLPYLAPERLTGAAASHRADLFSAGAVLFFLCTGKALVAGTDRTELQAAWQKTRPALLAEMRPDLPVKFVQWLCSLLELTPEKRPESAVDALASLAALNPPPPPIPPETFRPRAATQGAALPIASGIVKPPPGALPRPPSTIRKILPAPPLTPPPAAPPVTRAPSAAPVPADPPAPVPQPAKPVPAPVKKSHVAMTLGLFGFLVALIAGSVWFLFFRNTETKYPGEKYPGEKTEAKPASAVPERTPAPSVGRDIGKKYTPPPATPTPPRKPPTPKPAPPAPADPDASAAPPPPAAK